MARLVVLRIGHRFFRDSRVTTHVCLTARALGADGVIIADKEDKTVEATIREVGKRFGGNFSIESGKPWRKTIRDWKDQGGKVVHLTAYGLKLPRVIREIDEADKDVLVVVGSEKMPGEVFKLADWNVSVTNQPMSEVAALAVFLDWHLQHGAFDKSFPNGEVEIVPSSDRKNIQPLS
ncbi:MAG: tRNA (cytidine(56)-2'-O)-methyltransferase [Crenarchaeota archaeon 13_1_40CM_2_52_14]|nr:MAG: tRNA (cytidine(56)-2'-O)-methyltransferase [Crenarchaeota archaeon 13_1_40CM_3_52_17]OLD34008.1 MAG: tRNA (cytidine(56)-2'-O)-methyltransferase [Crenarchaeota archaeon 13_1_40CM_2_52_14]OLE69521.1 MAG: tRNA (cytidine(56)-2'-O)-methyltransferase [archaeon 13_1_20CM_2_51_12]